MAGTLQYQLFPRSFGVNTEVEAAINCFYVFQACVMYGSLQLPLKRIGLIGYKK
jgi:hypothetical protein